MEIHSGPHSHDAEITLNSKKKLSLLLYLCQNLDPYQKINAQMQKMLTEVGIHQLDDPFKITNQLIAMTEELLDKQHLDSKTLQ